MNSSPTVLILDDDVEFRSFLTGLVAPRGLRVLEASRVSEARQLLDSEHPDLCIVDGLLPDGTGMDFISEVRRRNQRMKIIFMSAFWRDMKTYKTLTEQFYVDRVINKPFLAREFLMQLEALQSGAEPDTEGPFLPASDEGEDAEPIAPSAADDQEKRLEAELAQLRQRFASRVKEKVEEIANAYTEARASQGEPAALDRLCGLAHKLHGTAGAYGFSEVAAAAGSIEALARRATQGGPLVWSDIEEAVHQLEEAKSRRLALAAAGQGRPMERPAGWEQRVLLVARDSRLAAELEGPARRHLVELVHADGLEEALHRAGEPSGLDGAIIDLDPSEANGFAVAQALRGVDRHAALPLAFLSSRGSIADRVAAAYAGASLFLTRPVQPEPLATVFGYFSTLRRAEEPRVLVVDDDPAFLDHVATILGSQHMKVTCLSEPMRVLDVMAELRPDLLLLDVIMPALSGYDICKMVRATPEWQSLPILFLTVKLGAIDRLACYEAGGDDYLSKPILPAELLARIRVRLERRRVQQERVSRDSLTGLLGRQAFAETMEKRLAENRRLMRPLALCLLDLDRFKAINDRHGHLSGDRVLRGLGRLLRSRFRTEDVRGRWGGEEFMVAFNGEGADAAREMLARVLEEFRRLSFVGDHGEPFRCTFSAGVSIFPDDGYTLEDLIRAADQRLYRAKEAGRDRVAI